MLAWPGGARFERHVFGADAAHRPRRPAQPLALDDVQQDAGDLDAAIRPPVDAGTRAGSTASTPSDAAIAASAGRLNTALTGPA